MGIKFKYNFFKGFFEEDFVPEIYKEISWKGSDRILYQSTSLTKYKHKVYSAFLMPDYLEPKIHEESRFGQETICQKNLGYAIRIDDGFDIDTHLKQRFKSNHKVIKRYKRRLESCFDIRYKMIYGDVDKQEFLDLMSALKKMLIRRFGQLQTPNENLENWGKVYDKSLELLLEKKASLFVIYNNNTPIDISLNFHVGDIMFASIGSYDIDYEKFGLGHVEIYKMLEWCLENDYKVMEMGYGDWDYKRRWSNHIYRFKHHVVFDKTSILGQLVGRFIISTIKMKEVLKEKEIHLWCRNLLQFKKKDRNRKGSFEIDKNFKLSNGLYLKKIDVFSKTGKYSFLKKQFCDFLYSTSENITDVTPYVFLEDANSFVFKGKNNSHKIVLRSVTK